jgi:hypothetical protein
MKDIKYMYTAPNGQNRPNARLISNVLFGQKPFLHNQDGISDFVPSWGVMLHLDITVAPRNTCLYPFISDMI